jgi:hypothetical protein
MRKCNALSVGNTASVESNRAFFLFQIASQSLDESQAQGRAVRANKKTKKLADFSLLRLFMMLIIYFINIYIVYILKEVISHRSTFSLVFSW